MESFINLDSWKVGIELLREVYLLAQKLPEYERFGMASQMRRAATSILTNLAEGFGRASSADKAHKYIISRGECTEVKALLYLIVEIGHVTKKDTERAHSLTSTEGRLLSGLIRRYS